MISCPHFPKHLFFYCNPKLSAGCSVGVLWEEGDPQPILSGIGITKLFDVLLDQDIKVTLLYPILVSSNLRWRSGFNGWLLCKHDLQMDVFETKDLSDHAVGFGAIGT